MYHFLVFSWSRITRFMEATKITVQTAIMESTVKGHQCHLVRLFPSRRISHKFLFDLRCVYFIDDSTMPISHIMHYYCLRTIHSSRPDPSRMQANRNIAGSNAACHKQQPHREEQRPPESAAPPQATASAGVSSATSSSGCQSQQRYRKQQWLPEVIVRLLEFLTN